MVEMPSPIPPISDTTMITVPEELIQQCAAKLERHGFQVMIADNSAEAGKLLDGIVAELSPASASYGDSMTLRATGILDRLAQNPAIRFYDGFQPGMPRPERWEIRRQGMTAELFLTGINALSADGTLYWVDMVGNRVAPIAFGPLHVVLVTGINKITATREEAQARLREIAPLNAKRHPDFKTPCMVTGKCHDCNSPDRLCNAYLTITRSFPKHRITVILIREEAGL